MTLIFMMVVMFTTAGPAMVADQYKGTLEECQREADLFPTMANKSVPGPDGEPATILDAQAKCIVFKQGTSASVKK